ncbi:killer cell lectin-like receptor subfamily B member 1B allele B [Ciconia boyciana]|uniref:killer cell lectin-like receptor subfamily B member 1B allele B n=1 Tax=Ciconia boyciana TaxID=52775 RepID=UPI003B9E1D55
MAGGPLTSPVMAGEIIYADLDIGPGKRCRKLHSLPQPGTSGCPQWHRTALWAGWSGNLLLLGAVVAMGCLLLHQQSENPGSCKIGSGNVGDGNTSLQNICLELRKGFCSSKLQEGEGCKLCPMGWTLHGTKCYWVVSDVNSWDQSKQDCVNRGAELLMPGDQEELRFLNEIVQKPSRYFWIGLSIPSAGKGWTWLNGSRLDQSRFQLSPGDKGRSCGMLREDRISSDNCSSALQWICQKEATQL